VFALVVEAINFAGLYSPQFYITTVITAAVFRVVVPLTVLQINLMVVREVRRRASNDAVTSLGLQLHQQTTSAVPTIMLVTTSVVYVSLCAMSAFTYMLVYFTNSAGKLLFAFYTIVVAVTPAVYAYNFYVYLITGKQFRSELYKLLCCCCGRGPSAAADVEC